MDETTDRSGSNGHDTRSPTATVDKAPETRPSGRIDRAVAGASVGILGLFVVLALILPAEMSSWVGAAFTACANIFGMYWQVLLLATFLIALVLIFTPWAKARLGNQAHPDFNRFSWIAMIMTTLLAAGGVFWAAAEPMYHYATAPPYFTNDGHSGFDAVAAALATSFIDWGFLAWAILGSLGTIVMMRAAEKGMPLRPRSLLYPILGARAAKGPVAGIVDVVCVIAVAAGTIGPVGFLGLQVSYGLNSLFGIPDVYPVQLLVIAVLTAVAGVSVFSGVSRGIRFLSSANIWMALALMAAVLVLGSAWFVIKSYFSGFALYMTDFFSMTLYRGDTEWLSGWTVFFFGWFLGYAPLMAIFIARISKGRTVRDLLISTTVLPPIATTFWFSVLGGTGIFLEQQTEGSISGPLMDGGLPAAVMAISDNLPLSTIISIGFLILTMTFVATTTDSMSFAMSQSCMTSGEPSPKLRATWALLIGITAAVLISLGDGGVEALQSAIVITAVPVAFVMLPSLFAAPIYVRQMAKEQNLA
ncbi:BCCT family transporter [Brevibacterium marinum]|uniref:Choline-glycine betaine transporter n=1 Tax=Brevibacterium marinum TaxID=418643 RepID=A0A846S7Q9_9MICO|nr:BCCT family transporter [Brevibacterium marinum]NJC58081.1 choline-glycine betaine transporter [Brevibacterium marinum]